MLAYAQIIISVLLIAAILLQQRGGGLSGANSSQKFYLEMNAFLLLVCF
jgi:preprotein translocase subunit SecG